MVQPHSCPMRGTGAHERRDCVSFACRSGKRSLVTILMAISSTCVLALFPLIVSAQDASVTAELSPNPVGVNDQVNLTITVHSAGGGTERPQLPKIQGLKLVGGPSVSNQFQWINGQSSSSQSFTYVFLPEKEGTVKIPSIPVKSGRSTLQTQELTLKVAKESTGQSQAPRRRSPFSVFDDMGIDEDSPLRDRSPRRAEVMTVADVDKRSVFLGEQITLTYKILTQLPITQIEVKEIPSLNGFWVEEIETSKNPSASNRVINGKQYAEYVIKKQALFPTKEGSLTVPSSTFALVVRTSAGGFFSFGAQEQVFRKTEPIAVKVSPLPAEGKPANFSGAVGNFKLESSIDKTSAETGEAINLKVSLSGAGNLKTITDFPLPELPGFKIYSSKSTDSTSVRNDVLQGSKTWEYVVIPQAPGKETIPALKFAYFSPSVHQYREAHASGLEVAVLKGKGNPVADTAVVSMQQGIVKRGSDIGYIKLQTGPLRDRSHHLYHSRWIYLGLGMPLLFNAGLLIYTGRQSRLRQDVTGFRSRRAGKVAEKRLSEAQRCLKNRDYGKFHSILESSLTGYLADKFNLPQIEVTGQQIRRCMESRGLNSDLSQKIVDVLEECNFARYAPAHSDPGGLETLYERARSAIVQMERTTGVSL